MDFQTRYEFNPTTDLLGRGGFSKVFRANDSLLDRIVALKFFTANGLEKYQVLNEIKKVIRFEHPNLCKYYDVAVLNSKNVIGETETIEVGIMEYLDAGDIKSYLKKNPEHIDKLLVDVLNGLSYLHKKGIVHRDLKPQNIIIKIVDDEPVAKITDFGISKIISSDDTNSSALIGTIEYMAPEQFNPRKYGIKGRITTNLDLWSFGLLVYEALQHKPLFGSRSGGISAEQVMRNILGDINSSKLDILPSKYRAIVKRCLVKNASERVQTALDLIPLFHEELIFSKEKLNGNKVNKVNPNQNGNTETNERGQKDLDEQVPKEPQQQENELVTQFINPTQIVTEETATGVEKEDLAVQQRQVGPPENQERQNDSEEVRLTQDDGIDDNTQFIQFTSSVMDTPNEPGEPHTEEVETCLTEALYTKSSETVESTQFLQKTEQLAGDNTQTVRIDQRGVGETETEVIQPVRKSEDEDVNPLGNDVKESKNFNRINSGVDASRIRKWTFYSCIIILLVLISFFIYNKFRHTPLPSPIIDTTTLGNKHLDTIPSVQMELVEGGSFKMGYDGVGSTEAEIPVHKVKLDSFYISKYEVTIEEFRQFVNDSGYRTTAENEGRSDIYKNARWESREGINWRCDLNGNLLDTTVRNIPVVHVSWVDAKSYCEWLSRRDHKHYRLPTEAEWEFAARGGNKSHNFLYSGSNNMDVVGWYSDNSNNKIHPVGKKDPNELALYDMSGNVMEWCNDWYKEDYYKVSKIDKPAGPDSGIGKVVRGGSWFENNIWLRNSFRIGADAKTRGGQLGFRICRDQ